MGAVTPHPKPEAYPAALTEFQHSCGSKRSQMSPGASNRALKVLAPIRRKWDLSFGNAISGIEIGTVWRQEREPTTVSFQGLCCARAFVGGQVIEDDNGAGFEFGGRLCFDVSVECRTVHDPGDDPGRDPGCDPEHGAAMTVSPEPFRFRTALWPTPSA